MSEMLALPSGHPLEGFVRVDPSPSFGGGSLPQEETDHIEADAADYQAEVDLVTQHEHDTATAIRDDRLDTSGLRVSALIPSFASISGLDLILLNVEGSGFTADTKIWWHDHLEPTDFVSESRLTTWVTPWAFAVPDVIQVGVKETAVGSEADGNQTLPFALVP